MTLLSFAMAYRDAGLAPVPIWPDKRKNPHIKDLKQYHSRLPTFEEWRRWARLWPRANLGLLTGYHNGYCALDFDTVNEYEFWAGQAGSIAGQTWTVKTGRGYHVWFQLAGETGNSRMFYHPDGSEVLLRAKGGYCIAPPSIHHTGTPYKTMHRILPLKIDAIPLPGWKDKILVTTSSTGEPAHHPVTKIRIEDMIKPLGRPNARGAHKAYCPFHKDKNPSAWVNPAQQRFGCNACFAGQYWDTANVYAMLNGIENAAALSLINFALK